MRAFELIAEALKPSQYRPLVKGWNKERYADIFKDPAYEHDRNGYRIYIPMPEISNSSFPPNSEVAQFLAKNGYEIVDYVKGYATKEGRTFRIGKLLSRDEDLKKNFDNDPARAAQAKYQIVISRHPYDIAGMSTDRGWTSCMNLEHGINRRYVPMDIKVGSVVAYLTKKNDENINKPVARILIKPFTNALDQDDVVFGVSSKIYGVGTGAVAELFKEEVVKWADNINSKKQLTGIFLLSNSLYNDDDPSVIDKYGSNEERAVLNDPSILKKMDNPPEELQLLAVSVDGRNIRYINDPSQRVQWAAVKARPHIAVELPNASDDIIIYAITQKPNIFVQLSSEQMTERVQKAAVAINAIFLRTIWIQTGVRPSDEVFMAAINADPTAIQFSRNPSHRLQKYAVSVDPNAIQWIANPSITIQRLAVKKNPWAIFHIANPSDEIKQLAGIDPEKEMNAAFADLEREMTKSRI